MNLLLKNLAVGVGLALLAMAPVAKAASTNTAIINSAAITSTCEVTVQSNLVFGTYDPIGVNKTAAKDAQSSILARCTQGTKYQVAIDWGQSASCAEGATGTRKMRLGATTSYMTYRLFTDAGRSFPWPAGAAGGNACGGSILDMGNATSAQQITLPVYGRITAGQNTVQSGAYVDTLVVSMLF